MKRTLLFLVASCPFLLMAQLRWQNVDAQFQPLPATVHVYRSHDSLDGKPNTAYYVIADLKDKQLDFTSQAGYGKRLTPTQYFEQEGNPLLVMNCTFFEFVHNSNQNLVIKDGKMLAYQLHTINGRGKDTFTYRHPYGSAIGISKKRTADVAWLYTDSVARYPYASQQSISFFKDSAAYHTRKEMLQHGNFSKWKMQTAVGGGPVLLQNGEIMITNNEELKFGGKAIDDKHPRTAMGYTPDGKLVLMVIQGRTPGKAEGATLTQEARMLKEVGCIEALNLDGGGSSCLLINGKQTIDPSDKEGQRPVPAVFMIRKN
ncbi:MAG: hypothetical protein JWQ78_1881 [Sediminibacterium sp.]|nr:hypothetical protein [Sediminibacterium sp.]